MTGDDPDGGEAAEPCQWSDLALYQGFGGGGQIQRFQRKAAIGISVVRMIKNQAQP